MGECQGLDESDDIASYESVTGLPPHVEAEMFRSIALSSRSAVVAADDQGVILWANAAVGEVFGWSPEELVGRPVTVLAAEESHEEAIVWRRAVIDGGSSRTVVVPGVRSDGSRFPLSVTPGVRRTPDGRLLGISLICRDLTEERRVREELTEALARSHARFDQVAQPQALLDLEARFVAVNDAACNLLGWAREELLGRDSRDFVYPVDARSAIDRLERLAQGEVAAITYEVVAKRGDAAQVPLHLDVSLVRDGEGRPRELAVFARDLTEIQEAQRRLQEQEGFFRSLYHRAADPAVVTDAESRFVYVSPSFTHVFGYEVEEVLGRDALDIVHPEDVPAVRRLVARALKSPGRTLRTRLRGRDARGRWRWFDTQVTNLLEDAAIQGVVANLREMTAEMEAQELLRRSESRYRAIAETAQEGIVLLDPQGNVVFANDKLAQILGVAAEELHERGLFDFVVGDERPRMMERLRTRHEVGVESYEIEIVHPEHGHRILSVTASPLVEDGAPLGSLGMVSDVTAERKAQTELRRAALHDPLTGLPNRALLVDRLSMAAARRERDDGRGIAVLFLDLDHFKLVNDSRGHDVGDRLLVEVAARIEGAVRDTDTVARLGGDEFAVVCEESSPEEADAVADRVLAALREPFRLDGETLYVSASIGIALSPPHRLDDLLRFADAAMYTSKTAGRGQATRFEGQESLGSERRLAIAGALREALAEDALTLGFQPIMDLDHGRLLGLEALLRWTHPVLGPVAAEEVVTAAETSGLSFALDHAVIRASASALLALRRDGVVAPDVYVSVNISSRTAQQQRLDDVVREVLAATGLPATCLALEITEHAIMDNRDHAVALLTRLAQSGIGIAIDDFGTGYNSLVHLQRLPVRTLKIDRSFVTDLETSPESQAIARSVVGLAEALGMSTIAEGVEHAEHLALLQEVGCTAGQGYLWSPAVLVDELPTVLARLALG
jgi:diguanylate cyclase (GGDEF)-like protein/PAS domain S-box-containing protein